MSKYVGNVVDYGALFRNAGYTICAEQPKGTCQDDPCVEHLKQLQQSILVESNFLNRNYYVDQSVASRTSSHQVEQVSAEEMMMSFDDYSPEEPAPLDISSLLLPPPNYACYMEPDLGPPTVTYIRVQEPTVHKTVMLNFNTEKTYTRENSFHHQHTKTVVTNVLRNHWHTQRVIVKDTNYHHYLINNQIKVNDIHHQKIENERRQVQKPSDYKQVQRVENAQCQYVSQASSPSVQTIVVQAPLVQQQIAAPRAVSQSPSRSSSASRQQPQVAVQRVQPTSSRPVSSSRPATSASTTTATTATAARSGKSTSPRSRRAPTSQQQQQQQQQPTTQYYYIVKKKK